MSWWRDPVLRTAVIWLLTGAGLLAFMFGLWIWAWPHG